MIRKFRKLFLARTKATYGTYLSKSKDCGCYCTFTFPLWLWKNPFNPLYDEKDEKKMFYWSKTDVNETIIEADKLFNRKKYFEVYQLLNRIKFKDNVEVHWRICRCLYKLAQDKKNSLYLRKEMIKEAYQIITPTLSLGPNDPNVHKWMALIIDLKTGFEGTTSKAKSLEVIKNHMKRAVELNPSDVIVLHMLGHFCYILSHFTPFQKFLASYFFVNPPTATFEEAYEYLSKAESIKPGFYVPNLYLLGKTCFHMKKYFRANYYLKMAMHLPARTAYEQRCSQRAKTLIKKLSEYDISRDALISKMDM